MTEADDIAAALDEMFDGSTATLNRARLTVADCLSSHGIAEADVERAALVVSELTTNAVEASQDPYRVEVIVEPEQVLIRVANRASVDDLPPPEAWGPDSVLAPRGRGLAIVEALSDAVRYGEAEDGWLEVTATLRRAPTIS